MDPVKSYALDIATGKIPACQYVIHACKRHLSDLKRIGDSDFPYRFDYDAADRFFRFCGHIKHYKGSAKGKPLELEPWQKFIFGNIYGWVHEETGYWRFNYAYIEIPRKNGKTTMAAAGAEYDAAFLENEETGAEIYCVATKEDQATLLVNDCTAFINQSEDLSDVFEVLRGKNTIYVRDTARTSFIRPLGSDSQRHDGLNPLGVYADELHAWPKRELWDVMEDAFGARDQWHMVSITTAGHNKQGICYEERKHLINILEGKMIADNKFGIIYTLDAEDQDDWDKEENWFKANPNLGTGKLISYMRKQVEKVKQVPSKLYTFLNKQLDLWTDVEQAWLAHRDWSDCEVVFTDEDLIGKECYGGVDLAKVGDLSAIAYLFPKQKGLPKPRLLVDFFIPREGLKERQDKDGVAYRQWADEGWLTLTNGKTTDWDFLVESVKKRNGQFAIHAMGYDRHFAGELVSALEKAGVEMVGFGMGYVSMGAPTSEMERLVVSSEIEHQGSPVLSWNAGNVVIAKDPAGNIKPDKNRSQDKIDGMVASIIALGMMLNKQEPQKPNPYAKRGMRTL